MTVILLRIKHSCYRTELKKKWKTCRLKKLEGFIQVLRERERDPVALQSQPRGLRLRGGRACFEPCTHSPLSKGWTARHRCKAILLEYTRFGKKIFKATETWIIIYRTVTPGNLGSMNEGQHSQTQSFSMESFSRLVSKATYRLWVF